MFYLNALYIRGIGGVPQNFGRVCCSMGPQQLIFYSFFKKEFSEIWGLCCSMGPNFFENFAKNSKNFQKFSQKINVLRFKMVLNGRILMNFDVIAHKTPHRLFFEKFKNFENFWEFDPQTPQKFTFYCSFKKQFSEKSRKFSKTAPSAPFSGASRPKILLP